MSNLTHETWKYIMNTNIDKNTTIPSVTSSEMEARYERAKRILNSSSAKVMSEKIVLNDTVYPTWIDKSNCFWYIRERSEGKEYRLVDADKALNELAFDHKALAKELEKINDKTVDPYNLPLQKIKFHLSQEKISFIAFDEHWWLGMKNKALTKKQASPQEVIDDLWLLSPDGKRAAFIRDYNIWVRDVGTGKEQALTHDGEEFFVYGVSEGVWGYTPSRRIQACWSPDSKHLFSLQRDTRKVRKFPVLHAVPDDGSIAPQVEYKRITLPGDEHTEELRLVVIDVEHENVVEIDYRRIP